MNSDAHNRECVNSFKIVEFSLVSSNLFSCSVIRQYSELNIRSSIWENFKLLN